MKLWCAMTLHVFRSHSSARRLSCSLVLSGMSFTATSHARPGTWARYTDPNSPWPRMALDGSDSLEALNLHSCAGWWLQWEGRGVGTERERERERERGGGGGGGHTDTQTHRHAHTHTNTDAHTHRRTQTHTHTHTHAQTYTHTHRRCELCAPLPSCLPVY